MQIPWPYTSAPGEDQQEGGGRLINVFAEQRGDQQVVVWRRVPGATGFAVEPSVGTWAGTATWLGIGDSTS